MTPSGPSPPFPLHTGGGTGIGASEPQDSTDRDCESQFACQELTRSSYLCQTNSCTTSYYVMAKPASSLVVERLISPSSYAAQGPHPLPHLSPQSSALEAESSSSRRTVPLASRVRLGHPLGPCDRRCVIVQCGRTEQVPDQHFVNVV